MGRQLMLLKYIDLIIGKLFTLLLTLPSGKATNLPLERILVIRPGGIGDAALLAQTINCINKFYPKTHITILAESRNCDVFSLIPLADKVFCYDRPAEMILALLGKYDVVIDTEQWYRLSAVVARFVRAPVKIGFDTNERRRMFTHGIRYDMDAYESDNFLALLKPLGA